MLGLGCDVRLYDAGLGPKGDILRELTFLGLRRTLLNSFVCGVFLQPMCLPDQLVLTATRVYDILEMCSVREILFLSEFDDPPL